MFTTNFFIGIGLIFVLIFIYVVFMIPNEIKQKKKHKKVLKEEIVDQKDWKKTALRLEGYIISLKKQLSEFEKNEKLLEKSVLVEQVKAKKMKEKLSQEREWLVKEEKDMEKRAKELKLLKTELALIQEDLGKEHSLTLKLQNEGRMMKRDLDAAVERKRVLEGDLLEAKTKNDQFRSEIAHLKKDNRVLSKKNEDSQWVAKPDFMKIEKELRETKKLLEQQKKS